MKSKTTKTQRFERVNMADGSNGNGNGSDGDLLTHAVRQELERGLRFSHVMEAANRDQGNEGLASVHALVKLLAEKAS